jgi:hypothetical protein
MEFVKVTYPADRLVNIDGEPGGTTNEVLRIDEGTHRFDLGKPVDYKPASQDTLVTGTTVLVPMIVAFTRKAPAKKAPAKKAPTKKAVAKKALAKKGE